MKKEKNSADLYDGNPFKFVPEGLDFAAELVTKSQGDYPAVCFSLCYAAARIAFIEKKNNPKPAFHLLLTAINRACEDIMNEEAKLLKNELSKTGEINSETLH